MKKQIDPLEYQPGEKIGQYGLWVNNIRGKKDIRNNLNNLTGKEWISKTSSVWEFENNVLREAIRNIIQMFTNNGDDSNILVLNNNNFVTREIIYQAYDAISEKHPSFNVQHYMEDLEEEQYQLSISFLTDPAQMSSLEHQIKSIYRATKTGKYSIFITKEFKDDKNISNFCTNIINLCQRSGLNYHGKITTYAREKVLHNPFTNDFYYILVFYKEATTKTKINIEPIKHVYPIKSSFIQLADKEIPSIDYSITKTDKIGKLHPATFSYLDVQRYIELFVGKNANKFVLDPFGGVGSTAIGAEFSGNKSISIELNPKFIELMEERLQSFLIWNTQKATLQNGITINNSDNHYLINGDSTIRILKPDIPEIDYCITSPPYHNILRNNGKGVRNDDSQFRQGIEYYSDEEADLGNQENYLDYIELHKIVMSNVYEKLKKGGYCSIVISDFTINKKEIDISGEIINQLEYIGFSYVGTTTLVQSQKVIYPFGYPFKFIINHTNQFIIHFRK